MEMNRRKFMVAALGIGSLAGCQTATDGGGEVLLTRERMVDAGPASRYAANGVYGAFRERGFFLVRQGEALFAVSAICTHKRCKLDAEPDRTFYCPCHGSTFALDGQVTRGPARRDLPILRTTVDNNGQLTVSVPVL